MTNSVKKSAIITGASGGLGGEVARRLVRDGFAVVVHFAGKPAPAQAVVAELKAAGGQAIAVQADVANASDVERLFQERQGDPRRARVGELSERRVLRLVEGLEHRTGEPRMALGERAAHAHHMHDRKKAGALEIIPGHRDRIAEQPADVGAAQRG